MPQNRLFSGSYSSRLILGMQEERQSKSPNYSNWVKTSSWTRTKGHSVSAVEANEIFGVSIVAGRWRGRDEEQRRTIAVHECRQIPRKKEHATERVIQKAERAWAKNDSSGHSRIDEALYSYLLALHRCPNSSPDITGSSFQR